MWVWMRPSFSMAFAAKASQKILLPAKGQQLFAARRLQQSSIPKIVTYYWQAEDELQVINLG